jgi:hypothetical protein
MKEFFSGIYGCAIFLLAMGLSIYMLAKVINPLNIEKYSMGLIIAAIILYTITNGVVAGVFYGVVLHFVIQQDDFDVTFCYSMTMMIVTTCEAMAIASLMILCSSTANAVIAIVVINIIYGIGYWGFRALLKDKK